MPTESEMETLRQSLIARATVIEQQDLLVAELQQDVIEKDVELSIIKADILGDVIDERYPITNRLVNTNDDKRDVALVTKQQESTAYQTTFGQLNTLLLQKRTALAEADQQRRIYRPDELMMLFYANSTAAPIIDPPPPTTSNFVCASVRVFPRAGYPDTLKNLEIQGSNTSSTSGFVTIGNFPASGFTDGIWQTFQTNGNTTYYKYLRLYNAPTNDWASMSEVEFRTSADVVIPAKAYFGAGWYGEPAATYDFNKAFDGNTSTFFSGNFSVANIVGIEVDDT